MEILKNRNFNSFKYNFIKFIELKFDKISIQKKKRKWELFFGKKEEKKRHRLFIGKENYVLFLKDGLNFPSLLRLILYFILFNFFFSSSSSPFLTSIFYFNLLFKRI